MNYVVCGVPATCGRKHGHRGHHGGWRSGVRVAGLRPSPHKLERVGTDLSLQEIAVLVAYADLQSVKEVATRLGLSEQTIKNHLGKVRERTGATSTIGAFIALGWLVIPEAYRSPFTPISREVTAEDHLRRARELIGLALRDAS